MAERGGLDAGRQVRDEREPEDLHAGLARSDRLERCRHAQEVPTHRLGHHHLGGGLVVGAAVLHVDALVECRIDLVGDVAEALRVEVGEVDEGGALKRGVRGEVDVVADQHRGAGRPVVLDAAGAVGQDHGLHASRGRSAHAVDDPAHAMAFVIVGASTDDERPLAARKQDASQRADVAFQGRLTEAGDFGGRDGGGGLADQVGGFRPSAAQRQRDVVLGHAGLLGDLCRGGRCDLERVGRGVIQDVGLCAHPSTLLRPAGAENEGDTRIGAPFVAVAGVFAANLLRFVRWADARNGGADARGPADARSGVDARSRCGAHPPLGENRGMVKEFARKQSIAILGGGPGGYEAALAGAQLGAEVTLVERVGVGGSAVLTDVVPSKTLIATAEAANAIGDASELGVQFFARGDKGRPVRPEVAVNLHAVNQRLLRLARQQSEDMKSQLTRAGVRIVQGEGRLDGPNRIIVSTGKGKRAKDFDQVDADTLVISVGASPRILDSAVPDGERILTWTQLYTLESIPEHLIVVGSGVTGAEFASAYRALGSEVTLISSRDQVLPGEDEDAARVIENVFTRNGMNVMNKSRASSILRDGDKVVATLTDGRTVEGSHCLMAVGSVPNTADIGLEDAGVQLTESGHIRVNRVARTSLPSVYAAGDCSDFLPLASVASMQGRTAVYHAMGDAVNPTELRNVTSNIFTQPEIATVGWTQKQIESGDVRGEIHKLPLAQNPRAKMMGIKDGFVKLFASAGSGAVIGGVIVAPKASELILPISIAIEHRLTVDDVAQAFAVYPSLSGSITDAARALHQVP